MRFEQSSQSRTERDPSSLGTLSSGERVFDRPNSHLHDNPELPDLISRALEKIDSEGRSFFVESVDLGENIGLSRCVETTDADEILYAQREKRQGLTRFVKNREPEPTSFVTIILKQIPNGYITIAAFVGPKAEREPWDRDIRDPEEKARSESFWNSHALIWGTERTIPGTEAREELASKH